MTVLVIGANGQIGYQLVKALSDKGMQTRAMIRSAEQAERFALPNVEAIVEDLEGDFAAAFSDVESVVFTAGSGAKTGWDKTLEVDLWAAIKSMRYAEAAGAGRYIMISSRGATDPDKGPEKIKPYLCAKFAADFYLQQSRLDYTILRPGRLTDDPATGLFRSDRPEPDEQIISRTDVVTAIEYCLRQPATIGKTVELYAGAQSLEEIF